VHFAEACLADYLLHHFSLLGKCISKDNSAYTYLPESIRAFPQGEVMQEVIRKAGFSEVHFKRLTFGICTLYVATK
jgi:demethylmenaquinone methyltransferase/2-methoxy-6-polyprenyl-1,4-benzoquinol methylase